MNCLQCGECCKSNPGWFAPGEIEKAAKYLSMITEEFVGKYLVIDCIELPGYGKVEAFVPLRMNKFNEPARKPLTRVDYFYRYFNGRCIFYNNESCDIYPCRPMECRGYYCEKINHDAQDKSISREEIGLLWYEAMINKKQDEL